MVQVEGDVVVPVETASPKHDYAARTLRPKIYRLWEPYLAPLAPRKPRRPARGLELAGTLDLSNTMSGTARSATGILVISQNTGIGALTQQSVNVQAVISTGK